jgi:hypothetical protein
MTHGGGERQRQQLKEEQLEEPSDDRQLPGRTAYGEELPFGRRKNRCLAR